MTQSAKVILRSEASNSGKIVTSVEARYPRFIHAEVMTHRVFSRNAASSRAIPVRKMIADIRRDPAMPIHWGKNQSGMQANEQLTGWRLWITRIVWLTGMWIMTTLALLLAWVGAHKQIVNRLVEPWAHITVIVTSTEWDNFFELRCHKDAQPEFQDLAHKIREAIDLAPVMTLTPGEWHLPYVTDEEMVRHHGDWEILKKVSTARCARVSYLTHDGARSSITDDLKLYDRLVGSRPLHASPAEHQCTPDTWNEWFNMREVKEWDNPQLHGNLVGWVQHRKQLERNVWAMERR